MRKLRLLAAALAVAVSAITLCSVLIGRWALMAPAPCSMPCQDLGREVETEPTTPDGESTYRPSCAPLQLNLELFRPQARRGTRYTLWHRLSMKNVSCYELDYLWASDFIDSWETARMKGLLFARHGLKFHVWGPDGKEVEQKQIAEDSMFFAKYLYVYDHDALDNMKRELHLDEDWGYALAPGQTISAIPSILRPLATTIASDRTGATGVGWSYRPTPKDAVVPPKGFKVLDWFIFEKPGKYRVKAEFNWRIQAKLNRPYLKRLPSWLGFPMFVLVKCGLIQAPDDSRFLPRYYQVHVESKALDFTVAP